ncbi:MAG: hypothetical protein VZQ55_07360 [Ruminococcus sp.]|nr:hypothetical protein [Ruminococcus sp.]
MKQIIKSLCLVLMLVITISTLTIVPINANAFDDDIAIFFSDSLNWNNISVSYSYNNTDSTATMEKVDSTDNLYYTFIPKDTTSLFFTSGNKQTVLIDNNIEDSAQWETVNTQTANYYNVKSISGNAHVLKKDPTCTEDGNLEYRFISGNYYIYAPKNGRATATERNEFYFKPIDKEATIQKCGGHWVLDPPVWTWDGYTSAKVSLECFECEKKFTNIDADKIEHKFENGTHKYRASVTLDGDTYTNVKSYKKTYKTSDGKMIKLNNSINRDDEDTTKFEIKGGLHNFYTLGIQKKGSTKSRDIRFVSVVKTEIIKDALDYGYVIAKVGSKGYIQDNPDELNIDTQGVLVRSCKDTDNTISGDYGKHDTATDYKYVSAAITNLNDNSIVAVKFYLKDSEGNVHYADYKNGNGRVFPVCAASYNDLLGETNNFNNNVKLFPYVLDSGEYDWLAWTWNEGEEGHCVTNKNFIFSNLGEYVIFAQVSKGTKVIKPDFSNVLNQTDTIKVDNGKMYRFMSWGNNKIQGEWIDSSNSDFEVNILIDTELYNKMYAEHGSIKIRYWGGLDGEKEVIATNKYGVMETDYHRFAANLPDDITGYSVSIPESNVYSSDNIPGKYRMVWLEKQEDSSYYFNYNRKGYIGEYKPNSREFYLCYSKDNWKSSSEILPLANRKNVDGQGIHLYEGEYQIKIIDNYGKCFVPVNDIDGTTRGKTWEKDTLTENRPNESAKFTAENEFYYFAWYVDATNFNAGKDIWTFRYCCYNGHNDLILKPENIIDNNSVKWYMYATDCVQSEGWKTNTWNKNDETNTDSIFYPVQKINNSTSSNDSVNDSDTITIKFLNTQKWNKVYMYHRTIPVGLSPVDFCPSAAIKKDRLELQPEAINKNGDEIYSITIPKKDVFDILGIDRPTYVLFENENNQRTESIQLNESDYGFYPTDKKYSDGKWIEGVLKDNNTVQFENGRNYNYFSLVAMPKDATEPSLHNSLYRTESLYDQTDLSSQNWRTVFSITKLDDVLNETQLFQIDTTLDEYIIVIED